MPSTKNFGSSNPDKPSAWHDELPPRQPVPADLHQNPGVAHLASMSRAERAAIRTQTKEANEDMAKYRRAIQRREDREDRERREKLMRVEALGEESEREDENVGVSEGGIKEHPGLKDGEVSGEAASEAGSQTEVKAPEDEGAKGKKKEKDAHFGGEEVAGTQKREKTKRRRCKSGWKGWVVLSENENEDEYEEERKGSNLKSDHGSGPELGRGKRKRVGGNAGR